MRQKPIETLLRFFVAYAAIWTLVEPIIGIVPSAEKYFSGELKFMVLLLVSLLIALYRSAVPKKLSIRFSNSVVEIIFGDLFLVDGIKAIPVSRFFFEIEVVSTSLQNKVIQFFVKSQEGSKGFELYKDRLSQSLEHQPYREVYRNITQRNEKYYPLGTSALVELKGEKYLLFSLAETEAQGHIPVDNCNALNAWIALEGFWRKARLYSRGQPVNIPLVGSGISGMRLNPRQILELNLLIISNAIQEGGQITTGEIRIVLHPKLMDVIDLNDFQKLYG